MRSWKQSNEQELTRKWTRLFVVFFFILWEKYFSRENLKNNHTRGSLRTQPIGRCKKNATHDYGAKFAHAVGQIICTVYAAWPSCLLHSLHGLMAFGRWRLKEWELGKHDLTNSIKTQEWHLTRILSKCDTVLIKLNIAKYVSKVSSLTFCIQNRHHQRKCERKYGPDSLGRSLTVHWSNSNTAKYVGSKLSSLTFCYSESVIIHNGNAWKKIPSAWFIVWGTLFFRQRRPSTIHLLVRFAW